MVDVTLAFAREQQCFMINFRTPRGGYVKPRLPNQFQDNEWVSYIKSNGYVFNLEPGLYHMEVTSALTDDDGNLTKGAEAGTNWLLRTVGKGVTVTPAKGNYCGTNKNK